MIDIFLKLKFFLGDWIIMCLEDLEIVRRNVVIERRRLIVVGVV